MSFTANQHIQWLNNMSKSLGSYAKQYWHRVCIFKFLLALKNEMTLLLQYLLRIL